MPHNGQTPLLIDSNGIRLLGTLFLARGDSPKPTALLLHGIPGTEKNHDLAHALRATGWNALIFHYRGCWGSSGNYNVHTIPDDVHAAVSELTSGRHPQIASEQIVLIGHSLGGWAAVLSAAADPRVRATSVIAGISIPDTMPFSDPKYSAGYTPWLSGISPDELAAQWRALRQEQVPVQQAPQLADRPLLIIHSTVDEVVPVVNGRALAAAAGPGKKYIEHAEANHSFTWHRRWLIDTVMDWIGSLFQSASSEVNQKAGPLPC